MGNFLCVMMLHRKLLRCDKFGWWHPGTHPGAEAMTHQSRVVFKLSLRQFGRVRLGLARDTGFISNFDQGIRKNYANILFKI